MNDDKLLNGVLSSAMSDPSSVPVYCDESAGKYYVSAESVENYMLSSMTTEITEAIRDIAKVNNIDSRDLSFVGYFNKDFLPKSSNGQTVLVEKSAEDNAMTLKQAQKYYNTLIRTCKSNAKTKEAIDECLKVLKECVKDMERELKGAEQHLLHGGRIKYALKAIIPFNSIYRLFKRNDWQAELSELAGLGIVAGTQFVVANNITSALEGATEEDVDGYDGDVDYSEDDSEVSESSSETVNEGAKDVAKAVGKTAAKAMKPTKFDIALDTVEVVIRLATYKSMLKSTIKKTKDAIAFLEKKKKELSVTPEKKSVNEAKYEHEMEDDKYFIDNELPRIISKIEDDYESKKESLLSSAGYTDDPVFFNKRYEDNSSGDDVDISYSPFMGGSNRSYSILSSLITPISNDIRKSLNRGSTRFTVKGDKTHSIIHIKSK